MIPNQLRQVEDIIPFLHLPIEVHFNRIVFVGYEIGSSSAAGRVSRCDRDDSEQPRKVGGCLADRYPL